MINAYFLSLKSETPKRGYWDMGLLEDLLKGFNTIETSSLPEEKIAIVVIPARHHAKLFREINIELSKIKKVLLFLMGDEESEFPIKKIDHKNIKIWVQNPNPEIHDQYRKFGTGYPLNIHNCNPEEVPDKKYDWMFAGQITHSRRQEAAKAMRGMNNGILIETDGFTKGIEQSEYYEKMATAKVIPCPSGPQTPDTFRLFEALELGCVPIADSQTTSHNWSGFWEWLFDSPVPFPVISEYDQLPGYVGDSIKNYPQLNNTCQAWWICYKRQLKELILSDLISLGGDVKRDDISVIIPVSPIKSHPDTAILDETINSVRYHLPDAEIFITFDGIRKEEDQVSAEYNEHIRRILWKYKNKNIVPIIFDKHIHQVGMAKEVMQQVKTPLVLYVEQDTPLVIDYKIEWEDLAKRIIRGESNLIRFHFEAFVPKEHSHMMIGKPENSLLKTVQWSQRPHLASTAFYKRILSDNFSNKANCFIEDLMHSRVYEAYLNDGILGWNQWRLHIYHPDGNIKRSYHTDGRAGGKKYDDKQVW